MTEWYARKCYGKSHGKLVECPTCESSEYCKEAFDRTGLHSISLDRLRESGVDVSPVPPCAPPANSLLADGALIRIIDFLLGLSPAEQKLLKAAIEDNRLLSAKEVAGKLGCSLQNVHQLYRKITNRYPQLRRLIYIPRRKRYPNGQR